MRLGIDFGTTRTVVACCDRGNYPVLSFADEEGDTIDWFPSVVAEREGELRFGFDALRMASDPEWTVVRSFKRFLSNRRSTPDTEVEIGTTRITVLDLFTGFFKALREAILHSSNRPKGEAGDGNRLVAVVATPANAHGAQRFVTLDAFRRAGFEVKALLNEPSAAGFEYTHRHRSTLNSKREHIVVYDLGGGTFDASLVHMSGRHHDAIATAGLNHLGGDDFDAALSRVVLDAIKIKPRDVRGRSLALLSEQCREAKERLNPNSRRIMIDLESCLGDQAPAPEVTLGVNDFYDACVPLVEQTIEAMGPVMARLEAGMDAMAEIAGIYVVGGASALPIVPRVLRERFGRRVHRSPYPSAAVAIGLAIAVDDEANFELSDRLSRHFGVFREGSGGMEVVFDPIFDRDTTLPKQGEEVLSKRRVYRAAHNVGRYRFVECAALDQRGVPHGDITAFDDVLFPFDPELREGAPKLDEVPVRRIARGGPLIEEQYAITPHGIVEVTIRDLDTGYSRVYPVGA